MNVQKHICAAFCEGLSVRKIPLGYAIRTPFTWLHGEPLVVFGEIADGMVRMRDAGDTLAILEDVSGDLTSETKLDAMRSIASDHGVTFDDSKSLFYSEWGAEERLGDYAVRFMSFLNRLQDLSLLSRETVRNAFRDELIAAVQSRFADRFHVGIRDAVSDDHKEYTADIIIKTAKKSRDLCCCQ